MAATVQPVNDGRRPKCPGKMEVYSRVTGYVRPVANFNRGKRQEFSERLMYNISLASEPHMGKTEEIRVA